MKSKKMIILFLAGCILTLAGCSELAGTSGDTSTQKSVDGLDKLGAIQVISREEGSGTRSAFAQMADFAQNDENSSKPDCTKEDTQIVNNAEQVIAAVEEDVAAIGYVSKGAITDENQVKVLSINGIGIDTKSGSYPLSRSFYLAYSGKLTDLEQDFLTYIHGAGQEIVEKSYVPVAKSSSFLSNKAAGKIKITGSTSVAPLMEELAEEYMKLNPEAVIQVVASDSSDGLTKAMRGDCDFGMSSRELKDYEKELLDYEVIANDDIAVIVNQDNPLQDISLTLLKSIYVGDVVKWEELNAQ
ncbi:MAG: substrate-binding domain-containing protein [Lachnospiraceae bacterium]